MTVELTLQKVQASDKTVDFTKSPKLVNYIDWTIQRVPN